MNNEHKILISVEEYEEFKKYKDIILSTEKFIYRKIGLIH